MGGRWRCLPFPVPITFIQVKLSWQHSPGMTLEEAWKGVGKLSLQEASDYPSALREQNLCLSSQPPLSGGERGRLSSTLTTGPAWDGFLSQDS